MKKFEELDVIEKEEHLNLLERTMDMTPVKLKQKSLGLMIQNLL